MWCRKCCNNRTWFSSDLNGLSSNYSFRAWLSGAVPLRMYPAERDSLERSLFRYIYAGRSSLERPLFGLIERDFLRMRYPQGYLSFSAMLWYVRLQPWDVDSAVSSQCVLGWLNLASTLLVVSLGWDMDNLWTDVVFRKDSLSSRTSSLAGSLKTPIWSRIYLFQLEGFVVGFETDQLPYTNRVEYPP